MPVPFDLVEYKRYLSAQQNGLTPEHAQAYVSCQARSVPHVSPSKYEHLVFLVGDYLLGTPSSLSSLSQLKLWLNDCHNYPQLMLRLGMLATVAEELWSDELDQARLLLLDQHLLDKAQRMFPAQPIEQWRGRLLQLSFNSLRPSFSQVRPEDAHNEHRSLDLNGRLADFERFWLDATKKVSELDRSSRTV